MCLSVHKTCCCMLQSLVGTPAWHGLVLSGAPSSMQAASMVGLAQACAIIHVYLMIVYLEMLPW